MNEVKRDFIGLLCLFAVLAVAGAGGIIAFRGDERQRARLTAEAPATIVDVYVSRGRGWDAYRSRGVDNVRINFRYSVAGKEFAATTVMNKGAGFAFKVGEAAKACYNPTLPEEAELAAMNRKCGI